MSQWCAYLVEVYPHTKLDRNRKKNFLWTYGWTYGVTTHLSSNLLGHRLAIGIETRLVSKPSLNMIELNFTELKVQFSDIKRQLSSVQFSACDI